MSSSTSTAKAPPPQNKVKLPLPSLDQLAARLSPVASPLSATTGAGQFGGNGSNVSATRSTRLPATLLARSSPITLGQSSNNSEVSLADSIKANPPSADDRSVSPTPSSTTSTKDGTQTDTNAMDDISVSVPGPGLTAEHLEMHNKAAAISPTSALSEDVLSPLSRMSSSKPIRGYKNVPTLDDITKRLHKTRLLSVDGTDAPPPGLPRPQPSQQNQQDRVSAGEAPHPLQNPWILYHDNKARQAPHDPSVPYVPSNTDTGEYEANLTLIGEFDTVEDFCRYFNWLKPPSQLERNSNYHLFKSGIKPMWEDSANANGGKWVLTMRSNPQLLDRCWSWLVFALVGEELEANETDEICGAVVSLRSKLDRIQLWTRSKDVERVNRIGKRLIKLLDVGEKDGVGLDFQFHQDERPTPSKYLSIQAPLPTSGFRNSFAGTPYTGNTYTGNINPYSGLPPNGYGGIPGGAFGAFNQPMQQPNPNIAANGAVSGGVPLGFPQGGGAMGTFGMGATNTAFGNSNTGGSWRHSGSGFRR